MLLWVEHIPLVNHIENTCVLDSQNGSIVKDYQETFNLTLTYSYPYSNIKIVSLHMNYFISQTKNQTPTRTHIRTHTHAHTRTHAHTHAHTNLNRKYE